METNNKVDLKNQVLAEMNARRVDGKTYIDSEWLLDKLLTTHEREAVEAERKEWLSGNRCSLCGGSNLDSKGLSDVCGKCYEGQ